MLYPNRLQAVLLFDRRLRDLETIVRDFTRIEGMKSGASFNMPETNPDRFYRLFNGAEELMLTFEYIDGPANSDAFRAALASPFTGLATPDIRARIARTQSHILVEASHGVMAGVENDPKIAEMFAQLGMPKPGASQAQFQRRLSVLALMTRVAAEQAVPLAVHWTQSDLLIGGEQCDAFAAMEPPSPLHIHPFLYGPQAAPGDKSLVGIRTFGARHWLGREILIKPSVLPWTANYETILTFLRVATMANGYVIPDGDTFGPEDRSQSFRVLHHDAGADIGYAGVEPADMPMYELVPVKHVAHSYIAPDHVPDENVFDDRAFPAQIMPDDQDAKMAAANEWAEKRKLAEGVGGKFEVRAVSDAGESPPPPMPPPTRIIAPTASQPGMPNLSGRGLRAQVFGRKGT
ncbi:MAG: hypothetical protein NWP98_03120 [Erythrobacter sp.]|nr:hypothetical protein [Erythrobacter sp.]